MSRKNMKFGRWTCVALLLVSCSQDPPDVLMKLPALDPGRTAPGAAMPMAKAPIAGASMTSMPTAGTTAAMAKDNRPVADAMDDMAAAGSMVETPAAGSMVEAPAPGATADGPDAGTMAEISALGTPGMLPSTGDYTQAGPFSSTMESNAGPGGGYTIFRPDPLGEDGFVHPLITFGPGILTSPATYTTLLNHLASHGYVIIVVNRLSAGPGAQANVDAMQEGLDWLIAQNNEAGPFAGVLAVDHAVPMGYSLGATASVQLSSHPAVVTTVAIHGHSTAGDPHGPVLLLTGTSDVIDSVRQTHSTLEEAPAILAALPIGHLDVLAELSARGRYLAPITAWLRYWVNADGKAKRFFWGRDCEMCTSPWITPETNPLWDAQTL